MSDAETIMKGSAWTRRQWIPAGAGAALTAASGLARSQEGEAGGKRIGFVDFDLTGYHPRVFLRALRGALAGRGFELAGCFGMREERGREWASANDVPFFASIEELNQAVDFFMVLAPSNPELHLDLCREVFPFRKPTYVDKTFAPDLATAKQIFALADELGTPVQTSSALRYSNVQEHVRDVGRDRVRHVTAWVAGSNYDEYVIHPVELVVSCLGPDAVSLMRRGEEPETQLLINFRDGRTGTVNVYNRTKTPYAASLTTTKATRYLEVNVRDIFVGNLAAILDFFETGEPNVDRRETWAILKILEAARQPESVERFLSLASLER